MRLEAAGEEGPVYKWVTRGCVGLLCRELFMEVAECGFVFYGFGLGGPEGPVVGGGDGVAAEGAAGAFFFNFWEVLDVVAYFVEVVLGGA